MNDDLISSLDLFDLFYFLIIVILFISNDNELNVYHDLSS